MPQPVFYLHARPWAFESHFAALVIDPMRAQGEIGTDGG
jgi:hypothetical protein